MPCRFPGPHPGGQLRGSGGGRVSRPTPGGVLLLGVVPGPRGSAPGGLCGDPPPGMATTAGGTHPTGMHSCC